jgi:HlyD family secretion protein
MGLERIIPVWAPALRVLARGLAVLVLASCRDATQDVTLVGSVERTMVEVSAPQSESILEIACAHGQHVRRGEVLARLDPTLAEADVAAAEAGLAAAKSRVVLAEQEWQRALRLGREAVASQQALDRAALARVEAQAQQREAVARIAAAQKRRGDLVLVSPVDGVVDQIPFDPGERVPAGAVIAVVLADGAPWVRVWLPERALAAVAPGSEATVRIDGIPEALAGRVLDVGREPEFTPHYALTERERGHLVYETRIEIEGAEARGVRPGLPAQVTLRVPAAGPRAVQDAAQR